MNKTGGRWRRIQDVFERARGLPPDGRTELLERECADDPAVRSEVESLLAAAGRPGAVDSLVGWLDPIRRRVFGESTPARLGPYEVSAELGRGGMGVVYRALDPRLGREVAVKVLHADLAGEPAIADRFVAEARAASALDHPHVCTVHDLGRLDDGRLYLAMAYYPGGSLADRLAGGPLAVDAALQIALQIAAGLHRAHEAGIVHRDVKPANVAFSAGGEAKILDFGVAKLAAAAGITVAGTILGTPRYMAPEQVRGEEVDRRADVWALAAVLYEMLAGRPAFADEEAAELRRRVLSGEPEPLERLRPEAPPAVRAAVARGLRKEPAERPPTAAAWAALLRGEGSGEPWPPAVAAAPPLPVPVTSFVGREHEVEALRALLARARLVTLTGPGGAGKTRLAIETARRLAAEGTAVRLVALADLRDPRLVPSTVARALGLETGGVEPLERIAAAAGSAPLLLLLDNLEHLVPAAAPWLAELLARCPGFTLLATSRGPLRLTAEHEFPVPPLAVADGAGGGGGEQGEPPAVRLFLDRAQAAAPDLELGPAELAAVAEICRRLDGLPLALELAAARVRLFPPRRLLERLRERSDLPGAGPRDLPDRQRTLRSAVAWSYELLAPDDRRLFRALSVFRGGFTIEQAALLAGLEPPALADGLDALLDQALLVRQADGGHEARFRLLETLRVFAGEELAAAGEASALSAVHRRIFTELAEEAAPQLEAGDQREWFARLDQDHDNLRAALDAAADAGDAVAGLRLATALWRYWLARGHVAEGAERLQELLGAAADADPALRLRALLGAATLAHNAGSNPRARRLLEVARELAGSHGDDLVRLQIVNNLAWVASETGDLETAEELASEGLALARALGDGRGEAVALNNLGFIAAAYERWDEACRLHAASRALRRSIGDVRGEGFALVNLAWAEREAGRLDDAAEHLREAFALVRPMRDRIVLVWAAIHHAALLAARGDHQAAYDALDERSAGWRRSGNLSQIAQALLQRGRDCRLLGRLSEARDLLEEALADWRTCGSRTAEAAAAWELGALAETERNAAEARRWYEESLRLAEETGVEPAAERARAALGRLG